MTKDRRDKVQLGCGTLILIGLIVLIFSGGRGPSDLDAQMKTLHKEMLVLEEKIDALTRMVEAALQSVPDAVPAEEAPNAPAPG